MIRKIISFFQSISAWTGTKFEDCGLSVISSDSVFLAVERTYLGYLRTSLALSMLGVIIAQLFRLQNTDSSLPTNGFFVTGIPVASTCILGAILVLLVGAYRCWRQQNAILRGKVYAGGWETMVTGIVVLIVGKAICTTVMGG